MDTDLLTLTLVQPDIVWEDTNANLDQYNRLVAKLQTDVLVLPEMFNTGFSMNAAAIAEPMDGPVVQWMRGKAQQLQCAVAGSLVIAENELYYNRFVWMQPDGKCHTYDKRHLFRMGGEQQVYTPGTRQTVVNYKGWRIMLQICYDLRFPVWSRNNPENPYDLLLYVASWPEARNYAWTQLLRARAIENLAYVAGVSRIGHDADNVYHAGNSALLNYKGETLWTQAHLPAVATFTLSKKELDLFRAQFPAWMDADEFELF